MRKPTRTFSALGACRETSPVAPCALLAAIIWLVVFMNPAMAEWQENGFLAGPDVENHHTPHAIEDGQGGMIVSWADGNLDDKYHIFAQRFDSLGNAMWQDGGVPICTYSAGTQRYPALSLDNDGGAYFIWEDITDGGIQHIYAQHVTSSGVATWNTNGIMMDDSSPTSVSLTMMSTADDGTAYAGWVEYYSAGYRRIKIMRLNTSGKMWASPVNMATVTSGYFDFPQMDCTSEGATVVFGRYNTTYNRQQVYYATMGPNGVSAVPPTIVLSEDTQQYSQQFTADALGGFYITWARVTANWVDQDISLTHFPAGGGFSTTTIICDNGGAQETPFLAPTDDGVVVSWIDHRYLEDNVFAQKVSLAMTPQWNTNGRSICTTSVAKEILSMVPDGSGGALINWLQDETIYSQRVKEDGNIDWSSNGIPMTTAGDNQDRGIEVSDGNGGVLAVWTDTVYSNSGMMIQRLGKNGFWGYPAATITSVEDVPGDQGGKVLLSFDASRLDPDAEGIIAYYSLWRALSASKTNQKVDNNWRDLVTKDGSDQSIIRSEIKGNAIIYWELAGTVNSYSLPGYSMALNTYSDHTETNEGLHDFQVITHAASGGGAWTSQVGQGWSVDNLGPSLVVGLIGEVTGEPAGYEISWQPNVETDIHHYVVHRGVTADFIPSSGNLLGQSTQTSYEDSNWDTNTPWHYKVAGVDIHANTGEFGLLLPEQTSGVVEANIPHATVLNGNYPNPFNPSTTISYGLANSEHVRLDIFNASGRLVRTLVDETQEAGPRSIVWNGRDSGNRVLSSGVYFYRLQTKDLTESKRMTLIK